MAKYFRITEIDAATFERMTGDELDCQQVVLLADDGNVYVAVDEDEQDYIDVDLEMFDTDGGADPIPGQIQGSEKDPLWEVTMQKEDISLLRIYAKNDMNCVKTAKEMGIHQSSVIYRFGKIKTETGLDARKFWDLVMLLEMEES